MLDTKTKAMIEDTIGKIEARIQAAESVKEERRQELLQLLGTLKSEVAELSKTHEEQAQSIAGFTEFEESHPRLVQIVNAISSTLSNLGI